MLNPGIITYAPVLYLRRLEVKAVEELSDAAKSGFLPTWRMRPWPNTNDPSRTLEVLSEAMGGRSYAVCMDTIWDSSGSERGGAAFFQSIQDDPYSNEYYDFVREAPDTIPCIRLTANVEEIVRRTNTDWVAERGCSFVIPVNKPQQIVRFLEALPEFRHENLFVTIDGGWGLDISTQAAAVSEVSRSILEVNQGLRIAISGSSFPDSFQGIDGFDRVPLDELGMFESVRSSISQQYNEAQLIYSDWATTRPPTESFIASLPVPRIDVPVARSVDMFRRRVDKEVGEDKTDVYHELAENAVNRLYWPQSPRCWGEYMIDITASGSEYGITNVQRNTASRINIHMHNRVGALSYNGVVPSVESITDL